ncbi:MAG: tetratricopeptide repeat protein [Candidatus Poribacteria bacterium]|nr:tetratricopeptide repeat protein [Candidatus Poribacteria bacterium]
MKQHIKFSLGFLVTLCLLFSCARPPQQVIETSEGVSESGSTRDFTVIRMEGEFGVASGFFVDQDKIATNIHVAAYPGVIFARSPDQKTIWTVEGVTAFDMDNDLVILKVVGKDVPLPLGDSDTLQSGETVSVVGYPTGKYTVSGGTLHSILDSNKWLQMNVKISPGNSGSPVINSKGQVIGIVSATEDPYSYAIPSNTLKALLAESGPPEPLAQWRERGPIRSYVYSSQGTNNYSEGRYDEAIVAFDKVIKLNPEQADAYYNRGLSKFRLGDLEAEKGNTEKTRRLYESGIEDSTQAIKFIPEDVFAYHNRAGGKFRLAQLEADIAKTQQYYQDAIDDWTRVIKLNPELADPYNNLGIAKVRLGETNADQGDISAAQKLYVSAIEDCTHSIQLNPENPDPYINRGYAQFRLGKTKSDHGDIADGEVLYTATVRDCTQAIQLNPENAAAYGNLGVAKAALGNAEGAIEDFNTAIRLDPENAEYFYERGLAKEALEQKEAAKADFEKAKELDPDVDKSLK